MDVRRKLESKLPEVVGLQERPTRLNEPRLRPSSNHLYFEAVARHGSIRKASETLHIASSAVNRRILDLEEEVGTALFERLPRGVRLTAAGEMLLSYVRSSLKELRKVETQIDQLRGAMRGVVRIAVPESVTPRLLPRAIARYREQHVGVNFHVVVDGPELLLEALVKDSVDLILTHESPHRPAASVLTVARHPLCAFVAPSHPLTQMQDVHLSDCAAFPLAIPDSSLAARPLIEQALEEASLPCEPALESDSIETLKSFARLGRAVCLSFRLGEQDEMPGLVSVPLQDPLCSEARLYLAQRRARVLPVAAAAFAEELTETLREMSAGD